MKNKPYKPLKPPKNKQKAIALALGSALALCSIIAPFTAYTVNADVCDIGNQLQDYVPQDYNRHPLGGFSLSCGEVELDEAIDVFDCPCTYGGNFTSFSNRSDLQYFTAWQNTTNGTFRVEAFDFTSIYAYDTVFQLVGMNVALVREHIRTVGWTVNTGTMRYDLTVMGYPILSTNDAEPELISYSLSPPYWSDNGQYKFYWSAIFDNIPAFVFSDNGTALFDMLWISFEPVQDYDDVEPVFAFANEGSNTVISLSSYAGRVATLYNWIYNGSPVETILSFPIDFLKTEIFPDFSFGMLLLIALGFILFGFALKIAFGG